MAAAPRGWDPELNGDHRHSLAMPSPSVSLGTRLLVVGFTHAALDQLPKAGSTDGPPAGLPLARGGGRGLGVSQAGPGLPRGSLFSTFFSSLLFFATPGGLTTIAGLK